MTRRLTMAQAVVRFLDQQHVSRDGAETKFFAGIFGIFGHGNVAGMGEALEQYPAFRYYLGRNEQAMVHTATAFAKTNNRLRTLACTSSIGPGATNMVTGAATATINRLPVLLLPGDIFARRNVAPVLQQLESPSSQDISVNNCFQPVARYWDRIQRPEQLLTSLPEAMRVLTSPSETGAVVVGLPQDVQAEAYEYPEEFFGRRVWHIPRQRCDRDALARAVEWIRAARKPVIVAGGGLIFSSAEAELSRFVRQIGIPVVETQAGKGSLPFDHELALGAVGVTGTSAANAIAADADLVIGIGTRYADFTTASMTQFQNPAVRFLNINVTEFDAWKHTALPLIGDARTVLEELREAVGDFRVDDEYRTLALHHQKQWDDEVTRIYSLKYGPPISQGEVVGVVNTLSNPKDVVVCAAGSLPADLHKLWRTRDSKGYHLEYGYSCMGYEIAGGLGIKMAAPERDVYVMIGDGSYLMMAQEIATSIQEGYKLNIILLDNHGFASIGGLSRGCGNAGMGTEYRYRANGSLSGPALPIDFVANAASLGAHAVRVRTREELEAAVVAMRGHARTSVVVIETDYFQRVPEYDSWWDVPVAEVSESEAVNAAYENYRKHRDKERLFL